MKNILIFAALCIGIVGCETNPEKDDVQEIQNDLSSNRVVVIDGCQYLFWYGSHREKGITHKGNCNNPEHSNSMIRYGELDRIPTVLIVDKDTSYRYGGDTITVTRCKTGCR